MRREMQGESIKRIFGAFMNHMIQVLKLFLFRVGAEGYYKSKSAHLKPNYRGLFKTLSSMYNEAFWNNNFLRKTPS